MDPQDTPSARTTPPPAPRRCWRALAATLRGLAWAGHWFPGALLALVLGAGVAGWVWSGRDGSLPQALGWAQSWLQDPASASGRLQASGAQGSLRGGGQVQQLRWTRQGLDVQLQGLQLRWSSDQLIDALLLRRLRTDALHIDQVRVNDQRTPTDSPPLQAAELPLPIELAWSVNRLELSGRQTLLIEGLRGHYRYGPAEETDRQAWGPGASRVRDAHRLRIDHIALAQGRYSLQAVLGAQAPLPLQASAEGEISARVPGGNSLSLQATASASGALAGQSPTLDLQARVQPANQQGTPTLVASARLLPGAPQPLHSAQATAHALDLATLWPQAPATALSGQLQAAPVNGAWRAQLDLRNTRSGPWDRQGLPLDTLRVQVEQAGTQWQITDLQATLGRSQLRGEGRYRPAEGAQAAQWQGALQARALDPARLWSTLAAGALDVDARAEQSARQPDRIVLQAQAQATRNTPAGTGLRLRELRLQGHWRGQARVLQIDEALLDALHARMALHGALDVAASQFSGSSTWSLPGVQGRFDGQLAAANGAGDLDLQVADASRLLDWLRNLHDLPVLGPRLREAMAPQALLREGRLTGQASLQAQWRGGLGPFGFPWPAGATRTSAPLQARIDLSVPSLSASLPGSASAAWTVSGARLQASGNAADLALTLAGQATQGPWSATLQTQGRAQGLWPLPAAGAAPAPLLLLDSLSLRASDARRADRVTDWTVTSTRPLRLNLRTGTDGLVLDAAPGQLQVQPQLRAAGRAPSPSMTPVTLAWDQLDWQAGTLQTRGRLIGLPLAWVDILGQAEGAQTGPLTRAGLSGDMVLDGDWDLRLPLRPGAEPPRLNAQLQRRSGDLVLLTDSGEATGAAGASGNRTLQAGLREASLSLRTQGRELQARLRWDSERLGQASADVRSQLAAHSAAEPAGDGALLDRWWPASSPLSGTLSARLPQVGVWSALAPPGWRMRGTLQANATLGGTRGAPDWRGTLQADQLALRSVIDGFEFSDGQLRANLSGEHIAIERFELKSPLGGALSATGQARWPLVDGRRQPQIDLQLQAQKLRVSDRADRRLVLSGQVNAQLAGQRLTVRGQLRTDAALFVLPDETTPTLGSDVVVRGGRNLPQGTSTVAVVQPDVSVDLDLGPQFEVRGRGLQARLTGQLNLRSTPALPAPRVYGVVRTATGSYRAYGQQLSIQTGELSFNGPYDDPMLNILALRPQARESDQQVGVQINGTAQAPRVRLVATPDLPDAEKLAWLVLGRPATGAGAEAAILQQAALALLAGNDGGLNGGLASALGLDEIGYRAESVNADGSTRAAAVTLGKRLSNELYLSYETGLAGAMGTVSVFYDISRRFTLRARAGEENAIDLIFTLQYD
jgi:translocation and assembly module TamB